MGEVDLRLLPRRRLEPYYRISGRARAHLPHVQFELRVTALVARCPRFLEQAHPRQVGKLGQALIDQRLVRIQFRRHRRARSVAGFRHVALGLPGPDPPIHRLPADPELARDLRHIPTLIQVVFQQHASLSFDHWRLRSWGSTKVGPSQRARPSADPLLLRERPKCHIFTRQICVIFNRR